MPRKEVKGAAESLTLASDISDSEDKNTNDGGYYNEERYENKRYLIMIVGTPLSFSSWINNRPRWWTEVDKLLYKLNKIEKDYHDQQWY